MAQEQGYRSFAKQIMQRLPLYGIKSNCRVLQVGCAVIDAISFMEGGDRYAVDPLADFYKQHFERANNPSVDYRKGVGESIPFQDAFFDVVICSNLLDHVANYHVVLEEIKRVLGQPNIVYFGTDVYSDEIAVSRWEKTSRGEIFDIQHPHTFTEQTLEDTLRTHDFEIVERYARQPSGKGDESWRHCLYATHRV